MLPGHSCWIETAVCHEFCREGSTEFHYSIVKGIAKREFRMPPPTTENTIVAYSYFRSQSVDGLKTTRRRDLYRQLIFDLFNGVQNSQLSQPSADRQAYCRGNGFYLSSAVRRASYCGRAFWAASSLRKAMRSTNSVRVN